MAGKVQRSIDGYLELRGVTLDPSGGGPFDISPAIGRVISNLAALDGALTRLLKCTATGALMVKLEANSVVGDFNVANWPLVQPVFVDNWPASQPVAVGNWPASQNVAVSNWPALQPVVDATVLAELQSIDSTLNFMYIQLSIMRDDLINIDTVVGGISTILADVHDPYSKAIRVLI